MPETIHADNLQDMRHGFFTSEWGNCGLAENYDQAEVLANRARVAEELGVPASNLLSCYQIHSPDVITVTKTWAMPERPKADAMVTSVPGIALGILTADCVSVLFADKSAGVIGGAHAGWRGAVTGVIENTIDAMEKLGASRKNIHAAIGPCIAQNSYEVGPEFPAPFLAEDDENKRFFRPAFKSDHYMFNLPGYVEAKLRKLGLISISPAQADTCADEKRFFSHRRATLQKIDRGGTLVSAIVLE